VLDELVSRVSDDPTIDRAWLQEKIEEFLTGFEWLHIRYVGELLTRLLARLVAKRLFSVSYAFCFFPALHLILLVLTTSVA
jgi:hypothetical protein